MRRHNFFWAAIAFLVAAGLSQAGRSAEPGSAPPPKARSRAACISTEHAEALRVRALESSLMVTALSCGMASDYNAFVVRYRSGLTKANRHVEDFFRRNAKALPGGANRYITRTANEASERFLGDREKFCDGGHHMFRALSAGGADTLANLAASSDIPLPISANVCRAP